jgi:hypothetical protein
VEDLPGLRIAPVVPLGRLQLGEGLERGLCELRHHVDALVGSEQAVAAEHRHEPRHAAARHRPLDRDRVGPDPERCEVEQALPVGAAERRVVGVEIRRFLQPLVEALGHLRRVVVKRVATQHRRVPVTVDDRRHVDAELPALPRA